VHRFVAPAIPLLLLMIAGTFRGPGSPVEVPPDPPNPPPVAESAEPAPQVPVQPPGETPAQLPGGAPSQTPGEAPTQPAGEAPVQSSGEAPAQQPTQPAESPTAPPVEPGDGSPEPRLAVLIYHQVHPTFENAYTVTPAQLESHVVMLLEEGYTFYTLEDVERLLAGEPGMPEKGVLLTFDDGYSSFYTDVMPIAWKYQIPVTCFVVTSFLEEINPLAQPHMSAREMQDLALSPLADLGGHSHKGHQTITAVDGTQQPFLTHRMRDPKTGALETVKAYRDRVQGDFERTAELLRAQGVTTGTRHFAFPFNARSEEAVRLGQAAGFQYFYVGGEKLVTPKTDPTAIPRINAGAPEITAEVLRYRLDVLFAQP